MTAQDFGGYSIIRSDYANGSETRISVDLRSAFSEYAGQDVVVGTDWIEGDDSISPTEILIGKTNREQSSVFADACKAKNAYCGYGMIDGKVILWGVDDNALVDCAEKFKADMFGAASVQVNGETEKPELYEGCAYYYSCDKKLLLEDGSEPKNSLREDILWGVNAHNKGHMPYTEENTEAIIRLAAEMGSTIYRINYNPSTPETLTYINRVIDLCHSYGMQVMMVMDYLGGTTEEVAQRMTFAAENLAGKVDYFQIFNETDIWCSKMDDGSYYNITNWTGMTKEYYNPERIPECVEKTKAAVEAFRAAAPDAKLVINIGSRHFPMLDWYVEAGISWDIIGIDLYDLTTWDNSAFLHEMEERYPGYDFMICEFNYPANSGKYLEEEQAYWLKTFFNEMNAYDSSRLKAVIVYELMDENIIQSGNDWEGEAHFGIVYTDDKGKPGAVKEGYRTLQEMLCGGICTEKTVYTRIP
ncbi:MAG: hypothetical protein MJ175_05840 [Clostridia bacterium]|nr:hypothetical protein [Clostridia bacterium]